MVTLKHYKSRTETQKLSNIDNIDVLILKTLLRDSRTTFAKIAQECGVSTNTVRLRHKRLKDLGIIKAEVLDLDPRSIGYNCCAFIGIITDFNEELRISRLLHRKNEIYPFINLVYSPIGKYNLLITATTKDISKLNEIVEEIKRFPKILRVDLNMQNTNNRDYHPENLVIESTITHNLQFSSSQKKYLSKLEGSKDEFFIEENDLYKRAGSKEKVGKIDPIDWQIIQILATKSRISFSKIANKLMISTSTVIERYLKLRKSGLIRPTIVIDITKIGYASEATIIINVSEKSNISKIYEELLRIPNITFAIKTVGINDIWALITFVDYQDIFRIREEIRQIPGIKKTEFLFYKEPPTNYLEKGGYSNLPFDPI